MVGRELEDSGRAIGNRIIVGLLLMELLGVRMVGAPRPAIVMRLCADFVTRP
jgi:hypothetical protein